MKKTIEFKYWATDDKIKIYFIAPALLITLVTCFANVFANLMASGEPVFLDDPWLAVFIALLPPSGSIALKFVSHSFDTYIAKKRYAATIYSLTAVVLLLWMVVFSQKFTGPAGFDWEQIGESNGKGGSTLVLLQLLAEVLVATSLALAAQAIYLKYKPHFFSRNPLYTQLKQALKEHNADHERLRDERNNVHARLVELEAQRKAFVNEYLAEFIAMRQRFNNLNNF